MEDWFNEYTKLGLCLLKVEPRGKAVKTKQWQTRTPQDNKLNEFWSDSNVGVSLGLASGGIVDVDLDCDAARAMASNLLPETGWIFGRASTPKAHWLYRIDGDCGGTKQFNARSLSLPKDMVVEYRATGAYTVFPPSNHKTGEKIEWAAFDEVGNSTRDELLHAVRLLAAAVVVSENYNAGSRQNTVMALSGALLKAGMVVADVEKIVRAVADYREDAEVDQRLGALRATSDKLAKGEIVNGWKGLVDLIGQGSVDDLQSILDIKSQKPASAVSSSTTNGAMNPIDMNDAGVANVFSNAVRETLTFVPERSAYFIYKDGVWQHDVRDLQTTKLFDEFVLGQIATLAASMNTVANADAAMKNWLRYRMRIPAQQAISQARSLLTVPMSAFDQGHDLFAVGNGVVDLATGALTPSRPDQYITKRTDIALDPEADCPVFHEFLQQTFGADQDLIGYVQRLLGSFMSGRTDQQEFYTFHGAGANGKSTLLGAVSHVLGPFAQSIMAATLFEKGKMGGGAASADLATLQGRRLAIAGEAETDQKIDAALIKLLTGGDPIKVKPLYKDPYEFIPTFKIVLVTNNRPRLNAHDPALVRRVKLIPFEHVVPRDQRDPKLLEKLKAEAPGILNFMIEGAMSWLSGNRTEPDCVMEATKSYIKDFDSVEGFLQEMTTKDVNGRILKKDLYTAYSTYCSDNMETPIEMKTLASLLTGKGYESTRLNSGMAWKEMHACPFSSGQRHLN